MAKYFRGRSNTGRRYRAVSQAFSEESHTKHKIGDPGDKFEQEADKVADKVIKSPVNINEATDSGKSKIQRHFLQRQEEEKEPVQDKFIQRQGQQEEDKLQKQEDKREEPVQTSYLQTQSEEKEPQQSKLIQALEEEEPQAKFIQSQTEKEEEPVQTKLIQRLVEGEQPGTGNRNKAKYKKESAEKNPEKKPQFDFDGLLEKTKAGGKPLDEKTLEYMQKKFGHYFGNVRIHTGPDPERLAKYMNAQAFTVGDHIFFNTGKYQTDTEDGLILLAHELTHVIQQGK